MERRYLLKAIVATSVISCLPAMSHAANKITKKTSVPESFGLERLKSTHIKAMGLLSGDKSTLNVVFIGDSWTHAPDRYSGVLAEYLIAKYGDAGSGWIGLGSLNKPGYFTINGCAGSKKYLVKYDSPDNWKLGGYANRNTPDISAAGSDKPGAKITVYGSGKVSKYKICYLKSSGYFKYKISGKDWITVNADSNDSEVCFIEMNEKLDGAWNIEFVILSGVCYLSGIMTYADQSGVIVNKLAATGSSSNDWASKDSKSWISGIKSMAPDLVTILFGTNDQSIPLSVSKYSANIIKMINRVREANDKCDILLIAPCENARPDNQIRMSKYAAALYEIAKLKKLSFLNLQPVFGENPKHYDMESKLPLIGPDKIHPIESTGGRLIAYSIKEALGV
ncbi:SGNH/GDSL hydrolase family protein [Salmonella enterica]|nr:SGNH/GDSL hydrolase family protein [Salmonella enterica]